MMNCQRLVLIAAAFIVWTLAVPSSAQTYFMDNFEDASDSTTFLGNVSLNGDPNGDADPDAPQAGFWDIISESQPWKIQVTQAATGPGPANPGPGPAGGTNSLGMERFFPSIAEIRGAFDEPATGLVSAEFDLWIHHGEAQFFMRDQFGPDYTLMPFFVDFTTTGQVRVNGGSLTAPFFVNHPASASSSYNHIEFRIDLDAQNFTLFVDGATLPELTSIAFPTDNPNLEPVSRLQQFAFLEPTGDGAFYVDNIVVQAATETDLDGDYNGNGIVDAADYVVWRKHFGLAGGATSAQGDGTGDGNVTQADYDFWSARFGSTSGSALATALPAPEPAGMSMLLVGILMQCCRGNRSRRK